MLRLLFTIPSFKKTVHTLSGPFSSLSLNILCPILYYLALLSPPRSNLSVAFFTIQLFITPLMIAFAPVKFGTVAQYSQACDLTIFLLLSSEYVFLSREGNLKKIISGKAQEPPKKWTLGRMVWAAELFVNIRGIGWTNELRKKVTPPRPSGSLSKRDFFLHSGLHLVWYILLFDVAHLPYFWLPTFLLRYPRAVYLVRLYSHALYAYAGSTMTWYLFCVISVAVRASKVAEWPNIYGRFRDGWTLRRFWGYVLSDYT